MAETGRVFQSFARAVSDAVPASRAEGTARRSSARDVLIIALVATLVMAPELAIGLTVTDNFRFNLIWPEQFADLFRSGHLYPRWLPRSWHGLGSPDFYFYPPLIFWITSLLGTVTGGALASERLVPLTSLILLAVSGIGMRAWLRARVGDARPLLGAMAYMLAPYHLYDLYGRGALAEASAYASVPLVMLTLDRLGKGRTGFVPVLALAFAALLFSHLPTALLVGLFLIAPYVAFTAVRAERPLHFLAMSLSGGVTGAMLAAVFVVPALALLPYVSAKALSGSFYRPENWFFWHIHAGAMSGRMLLIVPIGIAAFLFAAASFTKSPAQRRAEPLFWAVLTIVLVALIAGFVPAIWTLPGLSLVQFPWRALLLVEFSAVTLLAMAPPAKSPVLLSAAAVLGFAYIVLALICGHMIGRTCTGGQINAAEIRKDYQDAPEYLPAGTRIEQGQGPDDLHVIVPHLPLASATDRRARIAASEGTDGTMSILVDSPAPTGILLRRFYFPHWRLLDATRHSVALVANRDHHVVSFEAPAGPSAFRLVSGDAPYEALARHVTFIASLCLALMVAAVGPRRRKQN